MPLGKAWAPITARSGREENAKIETGADTVTVAKHRDRGVKIVA